MNGAFEIGAVALDAQQRALNVLANNVANMNTPAFRRQDTQFAAVMAQTSMSAMSEAGQATEASPAAGGVRFAARPTLDVPGEVRQTGSALDVAIDGSGFIELMAPHGRSLLWRGGTLVVNEDGMLASANGYPLADAIRVPDDASKLKIASDGQITATGSDGRSLQLGQLTLLRTQGAIEQLDDGLYRAGEGSRVIEVMPGEDGAGQIRQGFLEASNVDLTREMVDMLMIQRAYSANAQVISAADQLASITNSLKR
ncbi:flagellar hook-basal body protein [Novosphingobium beihaiensis]|uniref:Flagellar hook basal-body protein n=1 Tax=Novosphingobium beihaiensis TaxID=2930389 RepID=A0ABT0BPT6_9SPHN|nr:flagellar hook basal-body protein [Novosphingobium beihaiensis]MCJ2186998.1 flagellar hook basal-body protein [Novosphingobium beihaiensis]